MYLIDMSDNTHADLIVFPDGQIHTTLVGIPEEKDVSVLISIRNSDHMIALLEVANALDGLRCKKKNLLIPYLMGARYDRHMVYGDSLDLRVFANLINSMNFEKVVLFDVHSDVALQLIDRSVNVDNTGLVTQYDIPDSILICPDAGAMKKMDRYMNLNPNLVDIVYCLKRRDVSNGRLQVSVIEPEKCFDRNCIIIDDLCDGGGTFAAIASGIKPKYLTLMVTHAIFSKGEDILLKYFNEIYTTDSYRGDFVSPLIKYSLIKTNGETLWI